MPKSANTWALRLIKIAIAVVGLWWVITKTPWNDVATLRGDGQADILGYRLLEPLDVAVLPETRQTPPESLHVRLPQRTVKVRDANGQTFEQEIIKILDDGRQTREMDLPRAFFEELPGGTAAVAKGLKRQVGLRNLLLNANPWLLLIAWAILVVPFLITAWRWMKLMQPQGIFLPYKKCLALTFVGQFYSTFLPGITGGDLVKIIYASKVTGSKTKSTVTVLLDRVIGLVALLMIAGISASIQLIFEYDKTILNVALVSWGILVGLAIGTALYFSRRIRKMLGIDRLTESAKERLAARAAARERGETVPDDPGSSGFEKKRRRLAEIVVQFDAALHAYRGHIGVLAVAFGVSLVVQLLTPLSAYLAGQAFGMKAPLGYYFAFVPLALLAASIPIVPPGGIGVTESIFLHFFADRGAALLRATTSQTFALAQAVRFMPIAWNLIGAWWVVTGTYTRHQAVEESHHDEAAAPGS